MSLINVGWEKNGVQCYAFLNDYCYAVYFQLILLTAVTILTL